MIVRITQYQTAKDKNMYLQRQDQIPASGESVNVIVLDPNKKMQQLIGFGGAFTEAAAYTYSRLSEGRRKAVIDAYFHPLTGIGYTLGRVAISSCDFSFGNYTYVNDQDLQLQSFSIEHDRKWIFPMLEDAQKVLGTEIMLFAAPWSPPSWMKDNQVMTHGGSLLPDCYDSWARYFVKTVKAYREAGHHIFAVSTQNEPEAVQTWESCIYTGQQERDFIKNFLGPALKKAGLDTKITIWDHNRDKIDLRAEEILSDSETSKYVWGTAFHWYVSEAYENVGKVHMQFPDKHIINTECCIEGGIHPGAWETGERYGRNLIFDFNNWNEGFLDWNLIVDETGGPNHVGNFCDALIIADTRTDTLIFNSSYYYVAHFSKFIRPGAVRIGCEGTDDVFSTAFMNSDGSIVTVIQNEKDEACSCALLLNGTEYRINMNAHSIVTALLTK